MKGNNNKNNNSKGSLTPHGDDQIKCLKETLIRSLQMLKIGQNNNNQISERQVLQFVKKTSTSQQIETYGNWILALNAIADYCLTSKQPIILSQSEIYDFLTVAVATNLEDEKRRKTKRIDDIIFRIYRDIMANYQSSADALKIAYPKIIVDIIAILATGIDTEGKKIPLYNIESYYQTRKLKTSSSSSTAASTTVTAAAAASSIATIQGENKKKDEIPSSTSLLKSKVVLSGPSHGDCDEQHYHPQYISEEEEEKQKLVENLNQITGRSKKALELSLANLQPIDIRRLRDLCSNSYKLHKYCELVHGSEQRFKFEIQKELGRRLTDYQLQHASNSIRKAKLYIENVLDGKFVVHGSHGINHVKHNLEYGYQLIGMMQTSRRGKGVKGTPKS
ncbi:MAG TPA: hypothetical protein VIP70_07530 [Nitrososphaeraceae archaeon]